MTAQSEPARTPQNESRGNGWVQTPTADAARKNIEVPCAVNIHARQRRIERLLQSVLRALSAWPS
jgi:hypothetical protein